MALASPRRARHEAGSQERCPRAGCSGPLTRLFLTTLEYLPELLRDEITLQALLSEAGVSDAAAGIRGGNFVSRCIDGVAAAALAKRHITGQGKARCASWRQAPASAAPARTRSAGSLRCQLPAHRCLTIPPPQRRTAVRRLPAGHVRAARHQPRLPDPGLSLGVGGRDCLRHALHGSRDANYVPRNLKELLAPGGWLIFTETCRDLYDIMASAEFLMSPPADDPGLDFEDFRRGTGRIFITRQEWLSLLARAGFGGITCLPGPDSPRGSASTSSLPGTHASVTGENAVSPRPERTGRP